MSSATPFNKSNTIDEPHRVIKVQASDGKSGDNVEISYTNCKVVGNGSFGIVFSAKLISPREEEIAVKKVLQDKRFKVRTFLSFFRHFSHHSTEQRTPDYAYSKPS